MKEIVKNELKQTQERVLNLRQQPRPSPNTDHLSERPLAASTLATRDIERLPSDRSLRLLSHVTLLSGRWSPQSRWWPRRACEDFPAFPLRVLALPPIAAALAFDILWL